MPIVGGLDIHRKQITFDYLDTVTGQVCRGQVSPADRCLDHLGFAANDVRTPGACGIGPITHQFRTIYLLERAVRMKR
jgi:hypothetical protein